MAWETRQHGARYYCRSVRDANGNVRREYVGKGPEAERIAEQDRLAREDRRRRRDEIKGIEAKLADATQVVDGLVERNDLMVAACLLAAGFHCHRSEWRRRRDSTKQN